MKIAKVLKNVIVIAVFTSGYLVATVDAARVSRGKCLLEINNKKYINGSCPITLEDNGDFMIGASENEPLTYFAIISMTGKNTAEGFWNEDKGANHAHTPLGNLVRKGACWQNNNVKVCAWK